MVKPRPRPTQATEQEIEAFGNMAEQSRESAATPPVRVVRRHREPKVNGCNFRMTASQQKLLSQAAEVEDISQQKLLESIIWPALTERYGE